MTGPLSKDRELHDWLSSFLSFTSHGEAPPKIYFWVGVATIAGALRRRVWIDQATFKWYPNLYTILVAPPGVIAKTTTADLGFGILGRVPGIHFGPDVVTWQALFDALRDAHEGVPFRGDMLFMSALSIAAGEFGTFLKPDDREMVDQLTNLWDGRPVKKRTRMDGEQIIENPCLNILACTTPSWIAQSFPEYMIGGGFTSRCLFVYAEKKAKYSAYPFRHVPPDFEAQRSRLARDLERISQLLGPFSITPEALDWGEQWYQHFHEYESRKLDESVLSGYINRKQTLAHKIAMCLSASQRNDLVIDLDTLKRSVALLTELEAEMPKVYSKIGMSQGSTAGMQIVAFVKRAGDKVSYVDLYRYMHRLFPNVKDFNDTIDGLVKSGMLLYEQHPEKQFLFWLP